MEKLTLPIEKLPCLTGTTKDLINSGMWFLYGIKSELFEKAVYCLSADQFYYLDENGAVIKIFATLPEKIEFNSVYTFDGLPKPEVSRNAVTIWN